MREDKLYFELRLVDEFGKVHGVVRRPISKEAAYSGPRIVENIRNPTMSGATFEDAVTVMKAREFRRGLLVHCAQMAGEQLADFLEDREGWHGLDRQEKTEDVARRFERGEDR